MYPNLDHRTIFCFGPMRDNSDYPPYSYRQVVKTSFYQFFNNMDICLGNFVGKESLQYLGFIESPGYNRIRYINPVSQRYCVSSIVDGMSNHIEFEYDYLLPTLNGNHSDDFYTLDEEHTDAGNYIFSRSIPIKALKKLTTYNRRASTPVQVKQYFYHDLLVHSKGHGMLGFVNTTVDSYIAGELKRKAVRHFSVLKEKCLLTLGESLDYGPDKNLILRTLHQYKICQSNRNIKQFMLLPTNQIGMHYSVDGAHDFEKQSLVKNVHVSDAGNPDTYYDIVHRVETYRCLNEKPVPNHPQCLIPSFYQFVSEEKYEYNDNLADWLVNRPKSILTTAKGLKFGSNEEVKSLTVYEYGYIDHPLLPSKVTHFPSGRLPEGPAFVRDWLATYKTFKYTHVGTVKEEERHELYPTTLPIVTTTYDYTLNGLFLKSITNTKGYKIQFDYDAYAYGHLTRETDCNNQATHYSQDAFGITKTTVYPDLTQSKRERFWIEKNDTCSPPNATYCEKSTELDKNGQTMGEKRTYYDASGRNLRTVSFGLQGEAIFTDTRYNKQGLVERVSDPFFAYAGETSAKWTCFDYDKYGRTILTTFPDKTSQRVIYNGLTVGTTFYPAPGSNLSSQTTSKTVNVAGWTVKSTDAAQIPVNYAYYADGSLKHAQIGDDDKTRVSMEYDNARNCIRLTDPDYGTVTRQYDAYGQLMSSQIPRRVTTSYNYDELGRVIQRKEKPRGGEAVFTDWTYCNTGTQKGLLQNIRYHNDEQVIHYKYDGLNRIASVTETLGNNTYTTGYWYDDLTGRLSETEYPTGCKLKKQYNEWGHLEKITDENGKFLWWTQRVDAYGQITKFMTGNYVTSEYEFDSITHRLRSTNTRQSAKKILQDLSYGYDDFANLAARKDERNGMEECFTYDGLNRLTEIRLNGKLLGRMGYDAYGRILDKQADGRTVFGGADYSGVKPHAVKSATVQGNPFPMEQQDITYTMFDKVGTIAQGDQTLSYRYGYDHERIMMTRTDGEGMKTDKIYVGNCEFFIAPHHLGPNRTYLSGPLGVFAVAETINGNTQLHYVYKDHLGSWTTVTNERGDVEQRLSFDAWGTPRDPETWSGSFTGRPKFDRGFTGHEHLYGFGLINMNGRMYDPVMSSFLSVDNYVQAPDFSQSFNRYAYCLNNPLKYVDPSGECIVTSILLGAYIGAYASLVINFGRINSDADFVNAWTLGALGGAVGAAAGIGAGAAMSSLVGDIGAIGGGLTGASSGFAGGFAGSSTVAWCTGASFGDGLSAGLKAGGWGALAGGVLGGLEGGYSAYSNGGNFWTGDGASFDFPVPNSEGITMDKAYPNLRNFSGYDFIEPEESAWLQHKTAWEFDFAVGDMGVESMSTQAPDNCTFDNISGLFVRNKDGVRILGRSVYHGIGTNTSSVYVSPYAASHPCRGIFRAVVGHELTHSFHFYTGLPVEQNGPSEHAARDCSYMEYYRVGYSDLMQTIPIHNGYPRSYYVPRKYGFSTIDFFEKILLGK